MVFFFSRRHICIFSKRWLRWHCCILLCFCTISISRRFLVSTTNNLSDDTTAYSPLHIRHCHLRPRLEEEGGGVRTFLCIMRSVGHDLGGCLHQSDDDILFMPMSLYAVIYVLQPNSAPECEESIQAPTRKDHAGQRISTYMIFPQEVPKP
jgi:hypothetical protein